MTKLAAYKSKRSFKTTPEPKTGSKNDENRDALMFVVQKHDASHLHYDFRLECDGVLKSWAVPKGPSLNPEEKHLAIMVEDHPFDYRTFEGIIPKGNYGAGTVMVWDDGTYMPVGSENSTKKEMEKIVRKGIEDGHLDIIMYGEKLKGAFLLVRLKTDENQWLLFKKKDEYAKKTPVIKQDKSVQTGRSMEEISKGVLSKKIKKPLVKAVQEVNATDGLIKGAPKEKIPQKISPMLATLGLKPFDKADWIFEIKWDGYRAISYVDKKKVSISSRNDKSFNLLFPHIVEELKQLNVRAVFDGEVVVFDSKGKPQFQLLQNYQRTSEGYPVYYVFDLLHLNGHNLRSLPLIERKEILKSVLQLLPEDSSIKFCDHIEKTGIAFFEKASKIGLEGVLAKDAGSSYVMKRSSSWVKIKTHLRQEVVIGGFTEPQGSRKKIGALLVGVYENKKLRYTGHVGGGFTEKLLVDVYNQLKPLIVKKSPFDKPIDTNTPATWVKPKLVGEVSFAEWTSEGIMRQPIFKGLRIDKDPKDVVREG